MAYFGVQPGVVRFRPFCLATVADLPPIRRSQPRSVPRLSGTATSSFIFFAEVRDSPPIKAPTVKSSCPRHEKRRGRRRAMTRNCSFSRLSWETFLEVSRFCVDGLR